MKIQILVTTMHQNGMSLVKKMNIQTDPVQKSFQMFPADFFAQKRTFLK